MTAWPPDPLDCVRQWRAEADEHMERADTATTFEEGWLMRREAGACRLFAARLEEHMKGVSP